jgi:hypothetical protein
MTWRSKLGNEYDTVYMEKNEKAFKTDLDRMRKQPENRICADCASEGTVWASINLGVFLCLRCGSIHRGLGTHISVPKGCTGTYLWGPDELESMRMIGNSKAKELYGGSADRPSKNAGDDAWRKFIQDKYEHRRFVPVTSPAPKSPGLATKAQLMPRKKKESTVVNNVNVDVVDDLLIFDDVEPINEIKQPVIPDFFSEFGL